MRLYRFALISVLALLFSVPLQAQDHRWDIDWDPPILLSDTTIGADCHSPRVALSGDDIVHVTWTGGAEKWPYARSSDGGGTFARSDFLPDTTTILTTFNGRIVASDMHVLAFALLPLYHGLASMIMARSSDGGNSWAPIEVITDSGSKVQAPSITGDTVGFAYTPPPGVGEIMRSTNLGTTWSRTRQRFHTESRVALSNGFVHLIELAGGSGSYGLRYRRSRDLGETWEGLTYITPMSSEFLYFDQTIVARSTDDGDYVMAAWRDPPLGCGGGLAGCTIAGRIGKVEADSTRWFPTRVLTTLPIGYKPELASSRTGFAAVWPMDQEAAPFAQVRVSTDTSWGTTFDPVLPSAKAAIDLGVALASNAVHVVWEEARYTNTDHYHIMYRRGRIIDTDVNEDPDAFPQRGKLQQNYPNPFNGETSVQFEVAGGGNPVLVTLKMFDLLGREVATLANENMLPGFHTVRWKTGAINSGVYFMRLTVGRDCIMKKALLIR